MKRYSPSAGKLCLNFIPPRVPRGRPSICDGLIAGRQWISRAGLLGHGLTDGQSCGQPRRADILIKERRGDAQGCGDIVEAVRLHSRWAARFSASISTPSRSFTAIPYSVRVMRWIPTWPGDGTIGDIVERVLERTDERVDFGLVGLTAARRRHQVATHFRTAFSQISALSPIASSDIPAKAMPPAWPAVLWQPMQ